MCEIKLPRLATTPSLSVIPTNRPLNPKISYKARHNITMPTIDNSNPATTVTSSLANGVGGVAKTAGGIVGAAGRGVGQTVTGVTGAVGGKPIGDAVEALGNGIEGGAKNVGDGVEDAGKGNKGFGGFGK